LEGEPLKEFNRILLYLQKELELFSNLCFGRNYVNKKYLKNKLTMPVLMQYIWNNQLSQELRAVLSSLLMHVHIDNKPRTERTVPIYTKKLILSLKSKEKAKNVNSETFDLFGKEMPKQKISQKHDAVVDISKLSSYTKTIQHQNKMPFEKLEENVSEEPAANEQEIIDEFVKEDESIKEEDLKVLKDKILFYLKNEVVVKTFVAKHKSMSGVKFEEKGFEVNFNHLLLNMVQLTRKLILFECFAPDEKAKKNNQPKKIILFGKPKEAQNVNQFAHLVKALITILQSENVSDCEEKDKEKKNNIVLDKNEEKIKEKDEIKEVFAKALAKNMSKKKRKLSFANIEARGGDFFFNQLNKLKK